ncbi:CLUMA_CG017709, isoform A [Clunio marinus]|uniref:CLUMA_CG017709, isoform A n=1 Tax=Clunio marinus TaxID=568069 RepID=A0A1J1IWQ3_9DIPT|nr:CLUMA_CG017709, isoform A [Clunio marinus]
MSFDTLTVNRNCLWNILHHERNSQNFSIPLLKSSTLYKILLKISPWSIKNSLQKFNNLQNFTVKYLEILRISNNTKVINNPRPKKTFDNLFNKIYVNAFESTLKKNKRLQCENVRRCLLQLSTSLNFEDAL